MHFNKVSILSKNQLEFHKHQMTRLIAKSNFLKATYFLKRSFSVLFQPFLICFGSEGYEIP